MKQRYIFTMSYGLGISVFKIKRVDLCRSQLFSWYFPPSFSRHRPSRKTDSSVSSSQIRNGLFLIRHQTNKPRDIGLQLTHTMRSIVRRHGEKVMAWVGMVDGIRVRILQGRTHMLVAARFFCGVMGIEFWDFDAVKLKIT